MTAGQHFPDQPPDWRGIREQSGDARFHCSPSDPKRQRLLLFFFDVL